MGAFQCWWRCCVCSLLKAEGGGGGESEVKEKEKMMVWVSVVAMRLFKEHEELQKHSISIQKSQQLLAPRAG